MNAPSRPAAIQPSVSNPVDARKLADALIQVMDALLKLIEQETALVRAGKIREAMRLDTEKTDLSRRYVSAIAGLRVNQRYMATGDARSARRLAPPSRHVPGHAAGQPHGAGDRTRGVGRHRPRRQRRDAAPRGALDLYRHRADRNTAGTRHATPLTVSRTL